MVVRIYHALSDTTTGLNLSRSSRGIDSNSVTVRHSFTIIEKGCQLGLIYEILG